MPQSSTKTTRAVLLYVKQQGREDLATEIERRLGVPRQTLLDEHGWVPYETAIQALRIAAQLLGDPELPFRLGRLVTTHGASRADVLLARSGLTPENAFRRVAERVASFSRVAEIDCREVRAGHAVVAYRTRDVPPAMESCQYVHGVLSAVPELFEAGPVSSTHPECQLRGDPWCLFVYEFRPGLERKLDAEEAAHLFQEAVQELEERYRVLLASQERLHGLADQLQSKVDERTRELLGANERLRDLNVFKDRILLSLCHDLVSSVSGIQGLVEAIEATDERPPDARVTRMLDLIRHSADACQLLMDDLFDYTQIQSGQLSFHGQLLPLELLVERVTDSLEIVARSKSIALVRRIPPELPPVPLDRGKAARALTNLITNALKFAPSGSEVEVRLRQEDGHQRLEVIDSGPGVDESERERIFELYYQGAASRRFRSGSLGLGLYVVRQIMDLHGGSVGVSRTEDDRNCFHLVFPLRVARGAAG